MKKKWLLVLLSALSLSVVCALSALAETEGGEAEWTVLFYMCGSDLESTSGYATGNLEEIANCVYPVDEMFNIMASEEELKSYAWVPEGGRVNVVIQTGGCKQWHAQALGMDISTKALQRWHYDCYINDDRPDGFFLDETLPLASMADPETLADFIRWGAASYPAQKYALVLWDHGGGSKTGLFIDELFAGDVLYLDELKAALADGGVHFEAVLFDACLMANLETAWAVHDSASWMIASEELVAGKGTAVDAWLQQLYFVPECDGEMLGRWICDMTQIKYANDNNESAYQLMTWSVIDLSKIEHAVRIFDLFFEKVCEVYQESPVLVSQFAKSLFNTEQYGTGMENMWDLSGIMYRYTYNMTISSDLRYKVLESMMETVVYSLRGTGRAAARGLSFCYAADFDESELDIYARNCPSAHYLAMLDAISPWTAPDWVYAQVEKIPEIDTIEAYKVKVDKFVFDDGTPAFSIVPGYDISAGTVRYTLYRKNEETGNVVCLGSAPTYYDETSGDSPFFRAYKPWLWPTTNGELCEIDALNISNEGDYNILYNIPIMIDSEVWNLRCSYEVASDSYKVYGLWEGFDADSIMFNRNVLELAHMAGREFRLVYSIDGENVGNGASYEFGPPMKMTRGLTVRDEALPEGTYYIEYVIYDIFMRPMALERVELYWDGERLSMPGETWEGSETLSVADYYERLDSHFDVSRSYGSTKGESD